MYYYWDNVASIWTVDGHLYFGYDTDGNRTEYESQYFDPGSNDWQRNLLVNVAYDGNGNRTEGLYYHFDTLNNDWLGHRRYVYTYDGNGNRTGETNYHWDFNTGTWVNNLRNLITIDGYGHPTQEDHSQWDSQTNNWKPLKKVVHNWSDLVTDIPETTMAPDNVDILIYPNPVTDYLTIEIADNLQIAKIEIIDLYGRILRTIDNININSTTIQRGDLLSGIYLLRIHSDDIYTREIFIR
jgi:hypothetical protein